VRRSTCRRTRRVSHRCYVPRHTHILSLSLSLSLPLSLSLSLSLSSLPPHATAVPSRRQLGVYRSWFYQLGQYCSPTRSPCFQAKDRCCDFQKHGRISKLPRRLRYSSDLIQVGRLNLGIEVHSWIF